MARLVATPPAAVFVGPAPWQPGGPAATDRPAATATAPTVRDAIGHFLDAVDAGTARDSRNRRFDGGAAAELRWCLRGHVAEALGERPLAAVGPGDVQALLVGLADAGVPPRRVRAVAEATDELARFAAGEGLLEPGAAEGLVDLPDAGVEGGGGRDVADRAIALTLQAATLGLLVVAVVLLATPL